MSKLDELIGKLCPNGVEYKSLGEIATISRGGNFQKKDFCDRGVPCIHYGQIYTKYGLFVDKTITFITEERAKKQKFAKKNDIVMAVTSENIEDVCKCLAWLGNEEVAVSGHSAIIRHNQNPKYLVYYFHSQMFFSQKRKLAHGTKVIEVTPDTLKSIKLPVPPLEVQREIVHILDSFTLLTAELTAELTARKKQYEFYRDKILTGEKMYPVGRIIDMLSQPITDGPHSTPKLVEEGIPFLSAESVYDGRIHFEKKRGYITDEFDIECCKKYKPQKNDVFMVKSGSTTGKVGFVDTDERFNIWSPLAAMRTNENNSARFLFHLLQSEKIQKQVRAKASHGSQPNLSMRALEQFEVPIPPLEIQSKIATVLDNFDAICSDLNIGLPAEIEARQKQYEYYRDLLLTFAETGNMLETDRQTDRQTELSAFKLIQYVFGYVMLPLSKICHSISSGKAKTKDNIGKYPVYGSTGIIAKTNEAVYNKTNILVARVGANAGYTHLAEGCYDVSDNTLIIDVKNEYNLKYVYYQLVNMGLNRYAKGGGQPLVTAGQIKEVVIAIPAMREQERIVSILDHFDTLCNDLSAGLPAEIEARQKQYEYYRDKLLSFKGAD